MVDPDPASGPLRRIGGELRRDPVAGERAVPPRADGEERVLEDERLAVGGNAAMAEVADPFRDLFAVAVARIEVVVAGTGDEPRLGAEKVDVFADHHALRPPVDQRAEVEMVAGDDDHVEPVGDLRPPNHTAAASSADPRR